MGREDGLDKERIKALKRELKTLHGYARRRNDPGRVVQADEPASLEEKLQRLEQRTKAGEQALREGPRSGLTNRMRHARR